MNCCCPERKALRRHPAMSRSCHRPGVGEEMILSEVFSEDYDAAAILTMVLGMEDDSEQENDFNDDPDDLDADAVVVMDDKSKKQSLWSEAERAVIMAYYENEEEDEDLVWLLQRVKEQRPPAKLVYAVTETSTLNAAVALHNVHLNVD